MDLLGLALMAAAFISLIGVARRDFKYLRVQKDVLRRGVELDAEILSRFEAGALQGSELAKARQPFMASWDPYELELRYVLDGREIVSRGRVSTETFFHTRSMKTLRIKVAPDQPERWAALV